MPAAMLAPAAPPPPPRVDGERFALVQSIRLWKIEVRLAAEKLLSLGQAYEVQYTFPRVRVPGASLGQRALRDFGFDVMPVVGSHLFQVNEVRVSRFQQRVADGGWGPASERVTGIGLNDYLVGIGADNLLLSPMKLPRLRRRVSDVLAAAEREQAAGRASTVSLKFVRFDNQVRVDPLRNRGHGQVLQVLDELDARQAQLAKRYETLSARHRDAKKQLQVEKKVLMFVRIILHETRSSVMKAPEFQFAAGFRSWYMAIQEPVAENDFDKDASDFGNDGGVEADDYVFGDDVLGDNMAEAGAPETIYIDSPDEHEMIDLTHPDTVDEESDDEGVVQVLDLAPAAPSWRSPSAIRRLDLGTPTHATHSPRPSASTLPGRRLERTNSLPTVVHAQPQPSVLPRPQRQQRVPGPTSNIDASWIRNFPPQDLKWLSNRSILKNFTNGVADSFQADFEGDKRIPRLSCAIAETLFRMYLRKRGHMTGPALQKEFLRHARMLRSNIKNAQNPELRRDLVNGNITPQQLCEMTSDELAPEALRKERELRFEKHARQNMLREPTGPRLIKTKHGFKEVGFDQPGTEAEAAALPTLATINLGRPTVPEPETVNRAPVATSNDASNGDVVMVDHAFEPDVEDDRTSVADDASPRPHPESSAEINVLVESEVSKQFQASVGIRDKANQPAKKVNFSSDPPATSAPPRSTANQTSAVQPADEKLPAKDHRRKRRDVIAADGKAFLITLFGPTYDVISQLQDWAKDLGRVSMSGMSREFNLAPGVKLYRDLYSAASHGTFLATVQLGHIQCEATGRSDHEATYNAVEHLVHALGRFQRLFGDLLHQLSATYRLNQANDTRQIRDAAFNFLVETNIVQLTTTEVRRFHYGTEIIESDVVATIDDLPLARSRASTVVMARADAVQQLMTFLIVLVGQFDQNVEQRRLDYRAGAPPSSAAPEPASTESSWKAEPPRAPSPHAQPPRNESPMDIQDESFDDYHGPATANPRKRPYDHSTRLDDPPLDRDVSRRRVDPGIVTRASTEEPTFYVDDVGERPRVKTPSLDVVMKQRAEAYQELLTMVFRDEAAVLLQLREVDWKDQVEVSFNFSRKIQMSGKMVCDSSGTFTCTLVGLEDALEATVTRRTAQDAREAAINLMSAHIKRIHDCWRALLQTFKERSKVVSTLMAAHEVMQKHKKQVSNGKPMAMRVVTQEERLIAPYHCFSVYVDNKLAVSAKGVNAKDAKRASSEFLRDVLEDLVRIESQTSRAASTRSAPNRSSNSSSNGATSINGTASSNGIASSNGTASGNGTASNTRTTNNARNRTRPAAPQKVSQQIIASDASDDDDDYYSSGCESDWDPDEAKDGASAASAPSTAALTSAELMAQPYDLQSEGGASDDAKFRAVIRSLFTPADDLCAGINHLRGSLKYRGVAETVVVPNVKASIRINRLREGTFEVRVDVNDVIHFMEARMTKPEAINAAIDGILGTLSAIRTEWAQLLRFLHDKSHSEAFLDAYHAMKLAGIVSIKPTFDPPPSAGQPNGRNGMASAGLEHCVMHAGENVVFRVSGRTKAEAQLLAECRTAKFFEHLIDSDLNPAPVDEEKDGVMENAGALTADSSVDWSCRIRVQDTGNPYELHDFQVEAHWVHPHLAPSEREFPRDDLTVTQTGKISVAELETMLLDRHQSALIFFRLESVYNQQKLVKCVAAFGNKARARASALVLNLAGGSQYVMYVIPPGATINSSEKNLYWPANLPREIASKYWDVHGFLTPKHL